MANATMSKDDILEAISSMTVLELSELVEAFKTKFNVTISAAPVGAAPAGGGAGAGAAAAAEEQTEFAVTLKEAGAKKIQVIKVVRELTGLGLKEAKDLVDGAPSVVKSGVTKEEAATINRNPQTNTVDITLKVKERGKNSIGLNGGVSGIAGSFVGFNYSTNNFLGLGETLSIESQLGTRMRDVSFGFTEPFFLKPFRLICRFPVYRNTRGSLPSAGTTHTAIRDVVKIPLPSARPSRGSPVRSKLPPLISIPTFPPRAETVRLRACVTLAWNPPPGFNTISSPEPDAATMAVPAVRVGRRGVTLAWELW